MVAAVRLATQLAPTLALGSPQVGCKSWLKITPLFAWDFLGVASVLPPALTLVPKGLYRGYRGLTLPPARSAAGCVLSYLRK